VNPPVVLDADGLAALAQATPPPRLRALLHEAHTRHCELIVPTVVCAELGRNGAETAEIETFLARRADRHDRPAVRLEDTDFDLARSVGAILHAANASIADIVDAHVVAICVPYGGGLVVTADPDAIERLAAATPATHIVTRSPR